MSKEQSATSHEDPVAVLLRFIDGIKAEVKKTGKFSFEGESADYWITKFTLVKDALEEHEYVALEHEHLGCSVAKTGIYAPSETAPSEALKLAEQWKGRADDAGRLSRAVIESAPSEPPQKPIRRYRASVLDGYANIKEHPEGAYCLYSDVQAALASAPSTTPRSGATPRTDAALDAASLSAHETLVKLTKVSRDLERELTEAQRNGRIMVREYDALKAESALSATLPKDTREALIRIQQEAEGMRMWGGMEWKWQNYRAKRIHEIVSPIITADTEALVNNSSDGSAQS